MIDLSLCRRLRISWTELQALPEDHVDFWMAVLRGEDRKRRSTAAAVSAAGHA